MLLASMLLSELRPLKSPPAVIRRQAPPAVLVTPRTDNTYILPGAADGTASRPGWRLSVPTDMSGLYHVSVEYSATPRIAGSVLSVIDTRYNRKASLVLDNTGGDRRFGVTTAKRLLMIPDGDASITLATSLKGHDGELVIKRVILTPAVGPSSTIAHDVKPIDRKAFQVVGYLPEYRVLKAPVSAVDNITQLIFFSIEPTTDGGIDTSRLTPQVLEKLQQIRAHKPLPIMVAFGGGDRSETFGPMAVNPGARRLFVMDLLQFVVRNGFQGVDFDWEFPDPPQEHAVLSDLICETKAAFAPYGLQVSAALAPWDEYDAKSLAALDQFNYMTYTDDTHHAPLSHAQTETEDIIKKGAAPDKICMGIPFYGENVSGKGDASAYSDIVQQYHPAPNVDEVNGVGFNGIDTIQAKVRYAIERRLRGVMIWDLGMDTPAGTLTSAIRNAVNP